MTDPLAGWLRRMVRRHDDAEWNVWDWNDEAADLRAWLRRPEHNRQESIACNGSGALPDVYRVGDRAPGTERSTLGALDPLIGQPKPRAGER